MAGLVVVEINPTGQAAKAGIREYDVLFTHNGSELSVIEDLTNARVNKPENELSVIRGRELLLLVVPSGPLGVTLSPYPIPDMNIDGVGEVIARISEGADMATLAKQKAEDNARLGRIANIQMTTTPQLEGYKITKTLDIITSEYVGGMNIFRDIIASVTDIVGGRSGTMQNELRSARETCMNNLKIEADRLGANAVIGVDLDYSEISGGGKSMLFLVASGTAVIVE